MTTESVTCQDWYRVRRGEDEIAWGKTYADPKMPHVLFSWRSSQELAFLERQQKKRVLDCIKGLSTTHQPEAGISVRNGSGRRIVHVDQLQIVFRHNPEAGRMEISTIRGGPVLDPENVGPAPETDRARDD